MAESSGEIDDFPVQLVDGVLVPHDNDFALVPLTIQGVEGDPRFRAVLAIFTGHDATSVAGQEEVSVFVGVPLERGFRRPVVTGVVLVG